MGLHDLKSVNFQKKPVIFAMYAGGHNVHWYIKKLMNQVKRNSIKDT